MLANAISRLSGSKRLAFALVSLLATTLLLLRQSDTGVLLLHSSQAITPSQNSTLGFGAIYILTKDDTTWRIQGLRQAAKLTGLQLKIAVQRHLSDDEVYAYLNGNEPVTELNEIRAVMNYLGLLDVFIKSGHETAFFMEDDVDFGIDIKPQMEIISNMIHAYYLGSMSQHGIDRTQEEVLSELATYPYGKEKWDVFWMGHYGIELTNDQSIVHYDDPYALPWERLTSSFNNYYELLRPESEHPGRRQQQQIMLSAAPMGTYAFALTRETARKIVKELRDERTQQFDYALHVKCKGMEFKCSAPVPALMHHHRVIGENSTVRDDTTGGSGHDLKWWRKTHKYTYNIEFSARCNAEKVGERIGDRWQCMPGRYDVEE